MHRILPLLYAHDAGFAGGPGRRSTGNIGGKSKTDVIIFALRDLVRRKRIEELKSLLGRVQLTSIWRTAGAVPADRASAHDRR